MKFSIFFCSCLAVFFSGCTGHSAYVDPFIGSGGTGHVFLGAGVPHGLVQLGPTNPTLGWDFCSGYNAMDSLIIGFSHTHLSGTGMPEFCDITVMPVVGKDAQWRRGGFESSFSHESEACTPGFYSVHLDRYGIDAELTATARVGVHRYTFPASQDAAIIFDLENGALGERLNGWNVEQLSTTRFRGHRSSTVWADRGFSIQDGQTIWFEAEISKPAESFETFADGKYARISFSTFEGETVLLKVALSVSGPGGAELNLQSEAPGWNFNALRRDAQKAWDKALSCINVRTSDKTARQILYTSLFHTMIFPNVISDFGEPERYSNFSFWDTYRAQMPLYEIMLPERFRSIASSLLDYALEQGKVAVWPMCGIETDCMIGNPGIPVLADAVLKGYIPGPEAYEVMKRSAMLDERWQGLRKQYGFIPYDIEPRQSVAYETEYALADWAVAQVARSLGHQQDYEYFLERSCSWKKHFDPSTGFLRPLDREGCFVEPFDPLDVTFGHDYCEGNAWQYTFLVPHDVDGLAACFGSREALEARLDSLFSMSGEVSGSSADVTGMIGQYVHGNEPGHHIIYLYSMLGRRDKTAALVKKVLTELYKADPDGICGNEDMGQMSAWYILSALGFYQVEPCGGRYWLGAPLFKRAVLNLPEGRKFTVINKGKSGKVSLNGIELTDNFVSSAQIAAGGTLVFE